MRRIETVIFDLFGTLVDSPTIQSHREILTRVAGVLSVPPDRFIEEWNASYTDRATGRLPSTRDAILHLSDLLGGEPDDDAVRETCRLRTEYTRKVLTPRPDAVPTIERLRGMGMAIGLISDCSAEVPPIWEESPFSPLFDATIFSCSAGVRKPDPGIYGVACHVLGVNPGDVLYVGDGSSQELNGAEAVGMTPVLIDVPYERGINTFRIDEQTWNGLTIQALSEIPELITELNDRRSIG